MSKIKIAILGASGIGKFHAREFKKAGAEIVAILGSTDVSAIETSKMILDKFNIKAKPYSNLDHLLKSEELDAVSVCVPSKLHFEYSMKCLKSGVNVFSEKPVVLNSDFDNAKFAKQLVETAKDKNLIFTVNTQWPAIIEFIEPYVDLSNLKSFSMLMQPRDFGKDILLDQVPHMNSVLVRLIPSGEIKNITFEKKSEGEIEVYFDFVDSKNVCKVEYKFKYKESGVRDLNFEFNGKFFKRVVDENYNQFLVSDNESVQLTDPLFISARKFVGALRGEGNVLIGTDEIIKNIEIQDKIVEAYLK